MEYLPITSSRFCFTSNKISLFWTQELVDSSFSQRLLTTASKHKQKNIKPECVGVWSDIIQDGLRLTWLNAHPGVTGTECGLSISNVFR